MAVSRYREFLSHVAVSIAFLAAALAVAIGISGGFGTEILGIRVSANHPFRAAAFAAVSFLAAIAFAGRRRAIAIVAGYLTAVSQVLRHPWSLVVAVTSLLERYWIATLASGVACLGFLAVTEARDRPFWHDEIYTVIISELPFATIYRASIDGIDLAPPLNTALTRLVQGAGGVGPVMTRLTPIASFLATSVLVFAIVRRRAGTVAALTAALLPAAMMSWRYAFEARGYALSMACFAAALFSWLEAAAGRHVRRNLAILSLALAAGLWTHYYFVVAFIPIAIGEAVRQMAQGRVDRRPWMAILFAAVIALPLWPLVRASSAQRATFWAKPTDSPFLTRTEALYRFFFDTPERDLLAVAAVVIAVLVLVELAYRTVSRVWPRRLAGHELAALAACLLLPVAGIVLGDYLNVFNERYVLFTTVGVVVAVVLGLWWLSPLSRLAEIVGLVGVIAASVHLGSRVLLDHERPLNQLEKRPLLVDRLLRSPDPIVIIGNGVDYLEIWYYTPPTARRRVVHLDDPVAESRESSIDTVSRGYRALARWTPLPVVPFDDFVGSHPRFWMYAFASDWIEEALITRGATLIERGRDRNNVGRLYEVRMAN